MASETRVRFIQHILPNASGSGGHQSGMLFVCVCKTAAAKTALPTLQPPPPLSASVDNAAVVDEHWKRLFANKRRAELHIRAPFRSPTERNKGACGHGTTTTRLVS